MATHGSFPSHNTLLAEFPPPISSHAPRARASLDISGSDFPAVASLRRDAHVQTAAGEAGRGKKKEKKEKPCMRSAPQRAPTLSAQNPPPPPPPPLQVHADGNGGSGRPAAPLRARLQEDRLGNGIVLLLPKVISLPFTLHYNKQQTTVDCNARCLRIACQVKNKHDESDSQSSMYYFLCFVSPGWADWDAEAENLNDKNASALQLARLPVGFIV